MRTMKLMIGNCSRASVRRESTGTFVGQALRRSATTPARLPVKAIVGLATVLLLLKGATTMAADTDKLAVIESLLHEGQARHLPVTLEVEKDNPHAKRLYLRLGFVMTGEKGDRFCMAASTEPKAQQYVVG